MPQTHHLLTSLPTRRRIAALPVLAMMLALIVGCRPSASEGDCRNCNVILIVADTLRADRLGSFGYHRMTSPFLDRFAADSYQFTHARSQAACTFPSVNSLLTSQPVSAFLSPETRPGIPDSTESLPSILARHGYRTVAVSASPIVRKTESEPGLGGGFGQGFEVFDESVLWQNGKNVSHKASAHLRELRDDRFFLYVHYMDPHDPYQPLPEHQGTFAREYTGASDFVAAGKAAPIEARLARGEPSGVSAADLRHLSDLYDEAILGFDAGLQMLLGNLEALDLLDHTMVIVAADHGEAFLEHKNIKHCYDLYDTDTHVPLILKVPGASKARKIDELAENLDILPTVLDYLGIEHDADGVRGKSLRPLIETGTPVHTHAFSSMGVHRSVNDRRFKLIHSLGNDADQLFDRTADPGETLDLLQAPGPEAETKRETLRKALAVWMQTSESGLGTEEEIRRAKEVEDELRALGYLG